MKSISLIGCAALMSLVGLHHWSFWLIAAAVAGNVFASMGCWSSMSWYEHKLSVVGPDPVDRDPVGRAAARFAAVTLLAPLAWGLGRQAGYF